MGTINEKLNYLNETKEAIKNELINLGVDNITNQTTFREYANKINSLYKDMKKISDEGTTLYLTPTKAGKMEINLKGNIDQNTNILTYKCDGTEVGNYYFIYNNENYQFTMPVISTGDILMFDTTTFKLYLNTTEILTTSASTGILITLQATPNPDYPQDIKMVTGENIITISNGDNTESNFYSISLGNVQLYKIEDLYQDYLYKNNNKWYKKQCVKVVNLAQISSNNFYINNTKTNNKPRWGTSYFSDISLASTKLICNKLIKVTNSDTWNCIQGVSKGASGRTVYFYIDNCYTYANLNKFLQNTILLYPLENPIDIEITDSTLINQLEDISNYAISYNNQTNVSQINNNLPFIINATALLKAIN